MRKHESMKYKRLREVTFQHEGTCRCGAGVEKGERGLLLTGHGIRAQVFCDWRCYGDWEMKRETEAATTWEPRARCRARVKPQFQTSDDPGDLLVSPACW